VRASGAGAELGIFGTIFLVSLQPRFLEAETWSIVVCCVRGDVRGESQDQLRGIDAWSRCMGCLLSRV